MLRKVKREEVKSIAESPREKDFFPLKTSRLSTLPLSQLKIQNSLTVKCSVVQSPGRSFNLCRMHTLIATTALVLAAAPVVAAASTSRAVRCKEPSLKPEVSTSGVGLRKNAFDFE